MQRGEGGGEGARGEELCLRLGKTLPCGMSAHHVVAVDAVRRVLHAVVDFPPEHRQVLGEPAETDRVQNLNPLKPESCEKRTNSQINPTKCLTFV